MRYHPLTLLMIFFLFSCGRSADTDKLAADANNAEKVSAPYRIARSGQYFKKDIIDQAIADGYASLLDRSKVQHIVLMSIEKNLAATSDQIVVFGLAESHYGQTVSQTGTHTELLHYQLDYVILNAYGQPIDKIHRWNYEQGEEWTRSSKVLGDAKSFAKMLPDYAKKKLYHISGFLSKNPGSQPIRFAKTERELASEVFGIVFDLTPGIAKKIGNKVLGDTTFLELLEKGAKKLIKSETQSLVTGEELHIGSEFFITDEKALKYEDLYISSGKDLW